MGRRNATFSPRAAILLLVIGLLWIIPTGLAAQGPGLYKDGERILSLEEMTTEPHLLTDEGGRIQSESRGTEFYREVLAPRGAGTPSIIKRYSDLVVRCHDSILEILSAYDGEPIPSTEVEAILELRILLLQAYEAVRRRLDSLEVSLADAEYAQNKLDRLAIMTESYTARGGVILDLMSQIDLAEKAGNQAGTRELLVELRSYLEETALVTRSLPPPAPRPSVVPAVSKAPVLSYESESSSSSGMPYPTGSSSATGYDPADLMETIDVQFTDEIIALAAELGHSPAEIYAYVRNNLTFECYLGSRKGSTQTLEHMRGNNYDQASLLIALLRVSGIPARYAAGRVKASGERTANWLGYDDAYTAAVMLNSHGFNVSIEGSIGDVRAIAFDWVWVEAWIPFINYRGANNDSIGRMWIPLEAAFKQYHYESSINLYGEINLDAESFVEDYYSTPRTETPIDMFKQMMLDSLAFYHPGAAYEDMIRRRSIVEENDGIVPGTLPYEVLSFDAAFSEIPAAMRYRIRLHVYGSGTDLDYTTSLPEIASKQVTLSYVGATSADQQMIDDAGGIWFLPDPWLVDLKPVLKIDGCEVARGLGSVMTGTYHYSDMHFMPPTGAPVQVTPVQNYILAGNYQGLGIDTEDAFPAFFEIPETTCDEDYMGEVVHQTALTYLNNVDVADDELADMMHIVLTNDVSEAIVENTITVWVDWLGNPIDLEWTGMLVDADRKIVGPYSTYGDDLLCDFMRISGADGSIQENRVFETVFNEEAISTIKILALANDLGIPICEITSDLGDCPGIAHDSAVITAINNALAAGHHVTIPQSPLTYFEWTGTAWIDMDPSTCAAGYIIYGGHNCSIVGGGATVQEWDIDYSGMYCIQPQDPITVVPLSTSGLYCAESNQKWSFQVLINFKGKDADGNCIDIGSEWRQFHVNKTIKEIADIWGPGEYIFECGSSTDECGCGKVDTTLTVYEVKILVPDEDDIYLKGQEIELDAAIEPSNLSGNTFSWCVLEGTCDPASASTEDFETTLESEGAIRFKVEVEIEGTICEKQRTIKAVVPEVTEVNFQGTVYALISHLGDVVVSGSSTPEWMRTFGQDDPARNNDAAFRRNTSSAGALDVTCKVRCEASDPLTSSASVQVKADGDPENLYPKGAYFSDWTGSIHMDSGSPLRQSVFQYVNNYDYDWFYRVEKRAGGWGEWVEMKRNPTHHNISIVNRSSPGAKYQWVVMNSCRLASGVASSASDKEIIDQVYKNLPGLRASDDFVITDSDWADANRLKYGVAGVWSTDGILDNKGGMCGGWFQFFQDIAQSQGISVQKRCYLLQRDAGTNPEIKWYSILVDNPGLNQAQVTHPPRDFKDVDPDKYPVPLYLDSGSSSDDITYRASVRRYKFNSPNDGHCINFLESGGNNYLYDASFGPYTDAGIIENVYATVPLGDRYGAVNSDFRAKYFETSVPHLYGSIWYRYTEDTQLNGGIDAANTTINVISSAGADPTGAIRIGEEIVTYSGETGTAFTGCTRGQYGTTAAPHSDGSAVEIIKTETGSTPPESFSVSTPDVEESGLNLKWVD